MALFLCPRCWAKAYNVEVVSLETEIMKMALGQGLFAVLFVALLFYVLRHNEKREERLMLCLESLTEDVGEIKSDMESLKNKLGGCK